MTILAASAAGTACGAGARRPHPAPAAPTAEVAAKAAPADAGGGVDAGAAASNAAPAAATPVFAAQIDAAGETTCARLVDGAVRCWGRNEFSLVKSDDATVTRPIAVEGLARATQLSISPAHACALVDGTSVVCWGYDCGDLGIGNELPSGPCFVEARPKRVASLGAVRQISAHSEVCALLDDKTVTCWGDYDRGSGDARDEGSRSPVAIVGLKNVGEIATSQRTRYACARYVAGGIRCWQEISPGRVPRSKVRMDPAPIIIEDAVSMSLGDAGGCAVTTKGTLKCWGQTPISSSPANDARAKTQPDWKDVVQVALGASFVCARLVSGDVVCQGEDKTREAIAGAQGAVELACGNAHACVRKSDGSVHCWGENAYGQLGDGTTTSRRSAAPVKW